MWKKADVKQILHCHRNPKDLEDIPPTATLQSPQKMGEKEPLARIKATVNYLSLQCQSLTCFRCFEVHLLEDNPVLDEERRWCSTSIIMSLWLMTEKRTFCYYCKRACGYCKNPWKKWAQKREVLNCYHSISNYTSLL